MGITLFGIPNCDTVKKARAWLEARGVPYAFHDFKKLGVPADHLDRWTEAVGWECLINRRGTTFRGLPDAEKSELDRGKAIALMSAHPSLIKRPVVSAEQGRITVGFSEEAFVGRWLE